VPLSNYNSKEVAYVLLDMVLSKFGILIEIFMDQGMESCGEFKKLCEKTLINQYMTS
jgi:hypothetical protein